MPIAEAIFNRLRYIFTFRRLLSAPHADIFIAPVFLLRINMPSVYYASCHPFRAVLGDFVKIM